MRPVTFAVVALVTALLLGLQNCKSHSSANPGLGEPRPGAKGEDGFPELLPRDWDGRTDYSGSAFSIQ